MAEDPEIQEFCEAVNEITKSLKSTGAVVQSLLDKFVVYGFCVYLLYN
jgi:hypothetical protein